MLNLASLTSVTAEEKKGSSRTEGTQERVTKDKKSRESATGKEVSDTRCHHGGRKQPH